MIKLIACDIDGTLLPHGAKRIPDVIFEEVRRLRKKGILFCPASGRQYNSLRELFSPIADESLFLCENGAIVYDGKDDSVLSKTVMPRDWSVALAEEIQAAEDCETLLSGANITYVCSDDEEFLDQLRFFVGNNFGVLAEPADMPEDIIKVSAFCRQGAAVYNETVSPIWKERFSSAVAGPSWLDFTVADKGIGLAAICRKLNISADEVMAFGDNFNDAPMLSFAGHPYLMSTAHEDLKKQFPNQCANVADILKTL